MQLYLVYLIVYCQKEIQLYKPQYKNLQRNAYHIEKI